MTKTKFCHHLANTIFVFHIEVVHAILVQDFSQERSSRKRSLSTTRMSFVLGFFNSEKLTLFTNFVVIPCGNTLDQIFAASGYSC